MRPYESGCASYEYFHDVVHQDREIGFRLRSTRAHIQDWFVSQITESITALNGYPVVNLPIGLLTATVMWLRRGHRLIQLLP